MKQNRSMSADHHLAHLSIEEANIVVTKQNLAKQVRILYNLKERQADPEEIQTQEYVVIKTERILQRLEEAYSSTVS